jgi:hypothetical protein
MFARPFSQAEFLDQIHGGNLHGPHHSASLSCLEQTRIISGLFSEIRRVRVQDGNSTRRAFI